MSWFLPSFGTVAIAMLADMIFGYPRALHRRIGHPVEWMGGFIGWLDAALNRPGFGPSLARLMGAAAVVAMIAVAATVAILISFVARQLPLGWALEGLVASTLIAQRSLRDHVLAVVAGLDHSLERGRFAVSMIVGRDPASLDESGISKGALESLAENTSDGVVAPVFWLLLFGLPGIAVYKMINTANSMIGHKSDRYLHFGWAAARLDDLLNLPCSRLTGALFAVLCGRRHQSFGTMLRDAPRHQSPNAGWPEAALAGALGIQLGGPRSYAGETLNLPAMGDGRSELDRNDIRRGLRLYGWTMTVLAAVIVIAAVVS